MRKMESKSLEQLLEIAEETNDAVSPDHFACIPQGSEDWHTLRREVLELTGSEFAQAVGADESTSPSALYTKKLEGSPTPNSYVQNMLDYGSQNEVHGFNDLKVVLPWVLWDSTLNIEETGTWIFLDRECRLGSSPDGLIRWDKELKGVIEIKCPFNQIPYPSLELTPPQIKPSHYIQLQMEMAVTSTTHGVYCVWTPGLDFICTVTADLPLQTLILKKAEEFVLNHLRVKKRPGKRYGGEREEWAQRIEKSCREHIREVWEFRKDTPQQQLKLRCRNRLD